MSGRIVATFLVAALLHAVPFFLWPVWDTPLLQEKERPDLDVGVVEVERMATTPEAFALGEGADPGSLAGKLDDSMLGTGGNLPTALPDLALPNVKTEDLLPKDSLRIPDPLESIKNSRNDGKNKGDDNQTPATKSALDDLRKAGRSGSGGISVGERTFYKLEKVTGGDRRAIYVPQQPKFALENDSRVVLQFAIDKNGTVYDITFIERSDSRVERIALDYVRKMKFNAVMYESKDTARITFSFRVR